MLYKKFVITDDGTLRFGEVYHHRNLLRSNECCIRGGGLWRIDDERGIIVLYGRSFEFGAPSFDAPVYPDWNGIDGVERPIFYQPHWPYDETLIPVNAI